jgi:hypothetical protein
MNSANLNLGTLLCRALSSQVDHSSGNPLRGGTRWVSVQEGKLEEESEGEGWWQEWSSWTMSLIATTSSTCESVTGEGSGFKGARGTGGKPSIGVLNSTNSGDMSEDPGHVEGVMAERGDKRGGGVAKASGHLVA